MDNVKEKTCSICLSEIDLKLKDSQFLNCLHCFHNTCISEWFKTEEKDGSDLTCPTCRNIEKKSETRSPDPGMPIFVDVSGRAYFNRQIRFERKQNDLLIGLTGLLLTQVTENLLTQTTELLKKTIQFNPRRILEQTSEPAPINDELVATPELSFPAPSNVNILKLMGEPPPFDRQ